jgi:putative colanic acid biosynthesis UDP-glucose lipid carrier transferase
MQLRSIDSSFVWLHRFVDTLIPPTILFLLSQNSGIDWNNLYQNAAILSGFLLPIMCQLCSVYHSWRGRSLFEGSRIIFQSWLMTWALLIIFAFLFKVSSQYSRIVLSEWFLLTPIILIGYRIAIRTLLANLYTAGKFVKKVVIYGSGEPYERLSTIFNSNSRLGYELVNIYDDLPPGTTSSDLKGGLKILLDDAKNGLFQTLYIALPASRESEIKFLLNELSDTAVSVKYLPDLFSFDLIHSSMTAVGGLPIINIYDAPLDDPFSAMIKRLVDIILSFLTLLLISPFLLFIAIGIKLSSPGPAIFKQLRYGLNGDEINIYKFRSMTTQENGSVIKQASKNDPRLTRFGSFLRRTSLDELPQFINVLQGKMSIVGPRPHAVAHNEEYRKLVPKYMQRHLVKPGITGWAQVNGWRGQTDTLEKMQKRVEFDLFYINHWSLWMDVRIIILTVFVGFINKNAY